MDMQPDYFEWAKANMKNIYLLADALDRSVFSGKRVYINIPLTWETLVLIDVLIGLGIEPIVVPLSSGEHGSLKSATLAILKQWDVKTFADANDTSRIQALKLRPDVIFDCVGYATEIGLRHNLLSHVKGYLELTRTGVLRFRDWVSQGHIKALVIPIDDIAIKRRGEDLYGSGLALLRVLLHLNIYLPTKNVLIIGFGPIGQSCAKRLKEVGCTVTVVELDKLKALWAKFEAHESDSLGEVITASDIIVTCSGCTKYLKRKGFGPA